VDTVKKFVAIKRYIRRHLPDKIKYTFMKNLKQLEEFNTVNEGTWAWKGPKEAEKLKKELEEYKDRAYSIVGDDKFFDGLDSAISRLEEMIKPETTLNKITKTKIT